MYMHAVLVIISMQHNAVITAINVISDVITINVIAKLRTTICPKAAKKMRKRNNST